VTFRYRDNHTQRSRRATLPALEFIGRFLQHVLPPGCTKLRYYGLWSNSCRRQLEQARALLDAPPRAASDWLASPAQPPVWAPTPARCPHCRRGQLIVIQGLRAERKLPPSGRRGCLLIPARLASARCAARARARQCLPARFPGTPPGPSPPFFSRPGPAAASVTARATCQTGQKSTAPYSEEAPNLP